MGAFFHVAWFCSVCILPAGRRMWRGLPARRALPGRSGGQRADSSSGALPRSKRQGWPGSLPISVLPAGCTGDLLYRMRWDGSVAGPGKPLHTGHPVRMDDGRHPAGTGKMCAVPASKLRNGQAARQQTGRSICRSVGRTAMSPPLARKQAKQKGRPWKALPLFFCLWVALIGPERHPAGWARRVQDPRAGSARQAFPVRARQAAHFPQGRACPPRAPGPQLPGPEQPVLQPEQQLQERERWFPSLPGPGRLQPEWWLQGRQGPWPPQQERPRGSEPFPRQPHQQRALPARPFRRQLRGPQERCPLRQRPGLRGQWHSGAGQRQA